MWKTKLVISRKQKHNIERHACLLGHESYIPRRSLSAGGAAHNPAVMRSMVSWNLPPAPLPAPPTQQGQQPGLQRQQAQMSADNKGNRQTRIPASQGFTRPKIPAPPACRSSGPAPANTPSAPAP